MEAAYFTETLTNLHDAKTQNIVTVRVARTVWRHNNISVQAGSNTTTTAIGLIVSVQHQ
jgi:hypothetical protein